MSFSHLPSKAEVMGWSPQSLADCLKFFKLAGCDKVVLKGSITGAKFMQMTEYDLQVFPSLYVSIVAKIQSEINKGEKKKPFGLISKAKFTKQVFAHEEETWDSDEFDNDSDHDNGDPRRVEREDNYICGLIEPQTAGQQGSDASSDEDYEVPEEPMKPPRPSRGAKPQEGHNRNPVQEPVPAGRTLKPCSPPPRVNNIPPRPAKAPAPVSPPDLHINRSKKPGHSGPSQKDRTKVDTQKKGSKVQASRSFSWRIPQPKPVVPSRAGKHLPPLPVPTQPAKDADWPPEPKQDLDPSWYRGKVTRHQAEVALREVDKDGAFLVRDSSRGETEHPYTLMLLKQGKVYNIKVRNQGNSYSLGTGIHDTKSFPGVKEIITHHTHTPLLLIDAMDSEAQSHCRLLHPAGL